MLDQLASYKKQIDSSLVAFLHKQKQELSPINRWAADSIDRLISFCTSGKTIRGSLILWAHRAYGGKSDFDALHAAMAIELLHSGLLIHDDIMDADVLRRGKDSIWVQYNASGRTLHPGISENFGKYMAMCTGDLSFFLAQQCLHTGSELSEFAGIYALFSEELSRVCIAQMEDIALGMFPTMPSISEIQALYTEKTGRYTFSLPLTIGAILSHAPDGDMLVLRHLGISSGLLFQIKDDELNLYGDTDKTGKPVGSDIREAKKTIYMSQLYERASATDREKLQSLLQNVPLSGATQETVYNLLSSYGIRQHLDLYMNQLKQQSEESIEKLHLAQSYKKELQSFVAFVYSRDH